jgi:hypothetical protein
VQALRHLTEEVHSNPDGHKIFPEFLCCVTTRDLASEVWACLLAPERLPDAVPDLATLLAAALLECHQIGTWPVVGVELRPRHVASGSLPNDDEHVVVLPPATAAPIDGNLDRHNSVDSSAAVGR